MMHIFVFSEKRKEHSKKIGNKLRMKSLRKYPEKQHWPGNLVWFDKQMPTEGFTDICTCQ